MICMVIFFKGFWQVLKQAGIEFSNDNAIKLSASLSYYTIFSIAPMLVVIISLCAIFFGKEAIQGEIYGQINGLVGKEAAIQIQELIKNVQLTDKSFIASAIGIMTLLIGATGIFIEMQDSINFIWSIKAKPKKGWLKYITNRLISFALIGSLGFILLVSLAINALLDALFNRIAKMFPDITAYLMYGVNIIIVIVVISSLFAIIFKVLPDGKIGWKEAFVGAGFTSILFLLGKTLIGLYLSESNVATAYGSASSLIILLLWVYYSSVILYFGAEFTKVYAALFGNKIIPNQYAVLVEKREIHVDADNNKEVVQKSTV